MINTENPKPKQGKRNLKNFDRNPKGKSQQIAHDLAEYSLLMAGKRPMERPRKDHVPSLQISIHLEGYF